MANDLTFESACRIIKGEYPDLVNDIDDFSSIILTAGAAAASIPIAATIGPTVLTPAAIILTAVGTLSNLFGVKNEIIAISNRIIAQVTNKKEKDTLKSFERMQQAYTLICYTAFFEALYREKKLAPLLKKIRMTGSEKYDMVMNAVKEILGKESTQGRNTTMEWLDFVVDLPQPGDTPDTQRKQLLPLYLLLARRIEVFFELEIVKRQVQSSGGLEKIKSVLEHIPEEALQSFKDQYYGLAMEYPEFATWLNLQESERDRARINEEMAAYNKKLAGLVEMGPKSIDIGFKNMREAIKSIPQQITQEKAETILKSLRILYTNIINKPIIEDYSQSIIYPKKSEIFIPQAFQVLHYKGEHLEHNKTWKDLPMRDDLSTFLLSYFNHPMSVHTPLIILGQPGSGKSLLTSMLAARLIISDSVYTPVRVELRHVDTESSISVQIKDQIYKDTDLQRTWGDLTHCLGDRPPLVIFDGYDELLQATGKAFAGYLKDVEDFQENELTREQTPVRCIVTSRISLIDKADIPKNATVIRLLEFDSQRQNEWIARWNNANSTYFEQSQVKPFALPSDNVSISKLAEQPLLLMMLALYDSIANPLRSTKTIDQTLLYNELLRRFIERELKKDVKTSRSWKNEELDKAVSREMERLGVAAIGMFNRRKLYITKEDLNSDLKFFELEKNSLEMEEGHVSSSRGRDLLPAEKMFGSFFFQQLTAVRRSIESEADGEVQSKESDVAYEFLHNTFSEFLTADFMLHKILEQTAAIHHLTGVNFLRSTLLQKIEQFDGVEPGWFARFIYAPLFSRPVIINLLREWLQHCLRKEQRDENEFLTDFDTIVTNHIKLLFTTNTLPSLITKSDQSLFAKLPLIGYIAIYTLNLLLLRTLLAPDGYTFDETKYTPSADGTRVWDSLTYLWRSWFSPETLNELAAILTAERSEKVIYLNVKKVPSTSQQGDRLNLIYNVSQTLADNVTAGLSGFLLHDSFQSDKAELDIITKRLHSEQLSMPLSIDLLKKQIRHLRSRSSVSKSELETLTTELNFFLSKDHAYFGTLLFLNLESSTSMLAEVARLAQKTDDMKSLDFYQNFVIPPPSSKLAVNTVVVKEIIKLARLTEYPAALGYFSSRYFSDIIKLNKIPEDLIIELLEIAHAKDIPLITQYIRKEYLEKMDKNQRHISISLVVQMIKFAREVDDRVLIDYFSGDYVKVICMPHTRITKELAIEMISFVREVDNPDALRQLVRKCLEFIDGRFKNGVINLDIGVHSITFTIELLKAGCEIDDLETIESLKLFIRSLIRHKYAHMYLGVDLIVLVLKNSYRSNDQEIIDTVSKDYLPAILQDQKLVPVHIAAELLKLIVQRPKDYPQVDIQSYYRRNITEQHYRLGSLSLDTIMDLYNFAQIFGDGKLMQLIEAKLDL